MTDRIKQNIKAFLLVCGVAFIVLFIACFTWAINYSDSSYTFDNYKLVSGTDILQLNNYIDKSNCDRIDSIFPYTKYLQSDNWKDVNQFNNDYTYLSTVCANNFLIMNTLSNCVTTKLKYWDLKNIDSLNVLYNWVKSYKNTTFKDSENEILYEAVYDYWMNEIALALGNMVKENESIRYSFKYRFLSEICRQDQKTIGAPLDGVTKIINYVIEGKWYYLIVQRLWMGTHFTFKIVLIFIVITTLFSYFLLFKKLITKK
jgi:hypothetical protein